MANNKQPARLGYFFGDGYIEFKDTIADAFGYCGDRISDAWDGVGDAWDDFADDFSDLCSMEECCAIFPAIGHVAKLGFFFGSLILTAILTSVLCVLFSIFHFVVLFIIMLFAYVGFFFAWLADTIYCAFKGIGSKCPSCQAKFFLPYYECQCTYTSGGRTQHRVHTSLRPGKYGILKRQCECGRILPTTFFNGREKLPGQWLCPKCNMPLSGGPMVTSYSFPVVGGDSSGKTCLITSALTEIEKSAAKNKLEYKYITKKIGDDFARNKSDMDAGRLPAKTSNKRLNYYQFQLSNVGAKIKNQISLCDVAGETFADKTALASQEGFQNAEGFLIVIDPLSITSFRNELVDKGIDIKKYNASNRALDTTLQSLINTVESFESVSKIKNIDSDVVICFTKCDIPGLEELIGDTAAREYMKKHKGVDYYQAKNKVCEDFLYDHDEANFLHSLKSKFKSIQFFTSSALGHNADGKKFTPHGVEEPVLWLIDKASKQINLKEVWGKKI